MSWSSSTTRTRGPPRSGARSGSGAGMDGSEELGQLDDEAGALAGLALDADRAAMRLDDLPRDVQAEAEAAVGARRDRPLEAVEDPVELLGRDADAVVAHLHGDGVDAVLQGDL